MIHYVRPQDPDDRILNTALKTLEQGKCVTFPSETNWFVATSIDSNKGIQELYEIIGPGRSVHLDLICSSISQASKYALIPDDAYKLIKRLIPGPYIFLFESSKEMPRKIRDFQKDKKVAIRIPGTPLISRLVELVGSPLIARSVTPAMVGIETEDYFLDLFSYQIEEVLGHRLGMIIDPEFEGFDGPATLVDLSQESIEVIREGVGPFPH